VVVKEIVERPSYFHNKQNFTFIRSLVLPFILFLLFTNTKVYFYNDHIISKIIGIVVKTSFFIF